MNVLQSAIREGSTGRTGSNGPDGFFELPLVRVICTANAEMGTGRGCGRTVADRHREIGLGKYCFTDKFDDIVYWLCLLVISFFVV